LYPRNVLTTDPVSAFAGSGGPELLDISPEVVDDGELSTWANGENLLFLTLADEAIGTSVVEGMDTKEEEVGGEPPELDISESKLILQ
jgi:hypothetical protein